MGKTNRCMYCGCSYYPSRSDQWYCSARCRQNSKLQGKLILSLKKKWFDMILSGEKTEEYRERKPYWEIRLKKHFRYQYSQLENSEDYGWHFGNEKREVTFRNGYGENRPTFTALCTTREDIGREEWGAEKGVKYYVITVHEIYDIKNCEGRRDIGL